jgi:hypothetical protein
MVGPCNSVWIDEMGIVGEVRTFNFENEKGLLRRAKFNAQIKGRAEKGKTRGGEICVYTFLPKECGAG